MNLSELLNSPAVDGVIKNVVKQFGVDEKQVTNLVSTAVPTMLGKMAKNVQTPEGAKNLDKALESKHDGSILENIMDVNSTELEADGKGILGHVFGKEVDSVESNIAEKSGISLDKAAPILAMLAPVVMGYLGKEKRAGNAGTGGIGDILGSILGNGAVSGIISGKNGGIMDVVTDFLDKDNDGSVVDDVLGMFK